MVGFGILRISAAPLWPLQTVQPSTLAYDQTMPTRAQCQRDVYRLALLLTGSRVSATKVIDAVRKAQPDLRRLDHARLQRLTILRSREQPSSRLEDDRLDPTLATFLAGLDGQAREAWLLIHAFDLEQRRAAKAMDCSITALQLHLKRAHEAMADAKLQSESARGLHRLVATAEVPAAYVEKQRRAFRIRRMMIILGIVGGVLGLLVLARWMLEVVGS